MPLFRSASHSTIPYQPRFPSHHVRFLFLLPAARRSLPLPLPLLPILLLGRGLPVLPEGPDGYPCQVVVDRPQQAGPHRAVVGADQRCESPRRAAEEHERGLGEQAGRGGRCDRSISLRRVGGTERGRAKGRASRGRNPTQVDWGLCFAPLALSTRRKADSLYTLAFFSPSAVPAWRS